MQSLASKRHIRHDEVRVSWFSAWHGPIHNIVDMSVMYDFVMDGKDQQYGVVITNLHQDEPTEWNGGTDDQRD